MSETIPPAVRLAYDLEDDATPIVVGLVNQTFSVKTHRGETAIVQRLHSAFGAEVHWDIHAVSDHVAEACAARGESSIVPKLLRTDRGALWVEIETATGTEVWRALAHMPGRTFTQVATAQAAFEAGRIAGVFHQSTAGFDYSFRHVRPGVHDFAAHIERLRSASARCLDLPSKQISAAHEIAEAIVATSVELPQIAWAQLPRRIIHGDLKISNVRFSEQRETAIGLLDLDTFQHGYLLHEMGDALRSWCNRDGEDGARTNVDLPLFAAALEGYLVGNPNVFAAEFETFAAGMEWIALELASRFCLDIFEDRYFGWDRVRYPSRRAHNIERARGQWRLSLDVRAHRQELAELSRKIWKTAHSS